MGEGAESNGVNGTHDTAATSSEGLYESKYKVIEQIAKGSYGTVCTTSPLDDPETIYAVKIIDRTKLKQKDSDSVFREVAVLRELRELPHVITVIDFIEEPSKLYVVQFYARGGDLFRRLTERQVFTEKDARDIAVPLFETLQYMHDKHHIVHRDLKPENLLLENRQTEKIFFADFGFARKVTPAGLTTRCGTPAFVAPEIILGSAYHQPVDMWSIGCILFMLLGGYPPFHTTDSGGKNLKQLFRKIRAGDFTFHESQWKNVSPTAKSLIAKLLTVNPDYRYTAKQAVESEWLTKTDARSLMRRDLFSSLKSLKKFNGRMTLKGAMNAVKFAISADFWNSEAITFSRQTRKMVVDDNMVQDALWSPGKVRFDDEYEVKRKIRKGSCATVYECIHKNTQQRFAVKIIRRAKLRASEDEFVMNEVSIMQSLSTYGQYIVQLLDFYEEEHYFYLVMDYMGGGDVFDRVLEMTKYTEDDARKLTKILLKATRCMHEAGVAHRDLKPQNLLLTSKDDNAHIKVTDFGFARRVHTKNSLTSRCGTPTFVAPEILKNIPHDQSADLWSVGVVVYILLVGYPPFMKDTQADLFQQIRTGAWGFLEEDWENISRDAKEFIENLLVVDPEQRWTVEDALRSAWISEPKLENMNHDLGTSIKALRQKRERLRATQFSNAIYWETNDEETVPLQAGMKIQDGGDVNASRMSYSHEKAVLVHEC
eukprot:Nitzschia sp. Nitz4//scaffold322_size40381//37364//39639//NITZ4_007570-RA/size40381-augustus-gene-0.59-mRNA-1//-1//CDS//3329547857//3533//frame0